MWILGIESVSIVFPGFLTKFSFWGELHISQDSIKQRLNLISHICAPIVIYKQFQKGKWFWRNPIWNLSAFQLLGILVSASLTLSPARRPSKLFRVKLLSSLFPTDVFLAPFPHQRHFFLVKTLPIITFDQILFLCDPPLYHQGRKYVARPGILDMPWPFKVESGRMTHCCMWLKGGDKKVGLLVF